jgi:hypothetical protein
MGTGTENDAESGGVAQTMSLTIDGKDPDMIWSDESVSEDDRSFFAKKFLEFSEYYQVELVVNPRTGTGTCAFIPPKGKR